MRDRDVNGWILFLLLPHVKYTAMQKTATANQKGAVLNILQGSVASRTRRDGIFSDGVI